jgi:hypothetical protein
MNRPPTDQERILLALGIALERRRILALVRPGHGENTDYVSCAAHNEGLYCCADHLLEAVDGGPSPLVVASQIEIEDDPATVARRTLELLKAR